MKIDVIKLMLIFILFGLIIIYFNIQPAEPYSENDMTDTATGEKMGSWGQNLIFHYSDGSSSRLSSTDMQPMTFIKTTEEITIVEIEYTLTASASGGGGDPHVWLDLTGDSPGDINGYGMSWETEPVGDGVVNDLGINFDSLLPHYPSGSAVADNLTVDGNWYTVLSFSIYPVGDGQGGEQDDFCLIPYDWDHYGPHTVTVTPFIGAQIMYYRPSVGTWQEAGLPTPINFDIIVEEGQPETGMWLDIDETYIYGYPDVADGYCGKSGTYRGLENALRTGAASSPTYAGDWYHSVMHLPHWAVFDLGTDYIVSKVRGRSNMAFGWPTDVDVFVSDTMADWGTAVAYNIDSWHDTTDWITVDLSPKTGRYVKFEIWATEQPTGVMGWGCSPETGQFIPILDIYVEETPPSIKLYEYQLSWGTDPNSRELLYSHGQTSMGFTIGTIGDNENHQITSIKVVAKRFGSGDPGPLAISIQNSNGGKPGGIEYAAGSIPGMDITTGDPEWYEIQLSPQYELQADTQYTFVMSAPSADYTNYLSVWRTTTGAYTGGGYCWSIDSGETWSTVYHNIDYAFKEYGIPT